jgi:hypothetical protein
MRVRSFAALFTSTVIIFANVHSNAAQSNAALPNSPQPKSAPFC